MATSSPTASRAACLLIASALILLLFGDVLFRRASIAPIDYEQPLQNPALAPIARSFCRKDQAVRSVQAKATPDLVRFSSNPLRVSWPTAFGTANPHSGILTPERELWARRRRQS